MRGRARLPTLGSWGSPRCPWGHPAPWLGHGPPVAKPWHSSGQAMALEQPGHGPLAAGPQPSGSQAMAFSQPGHSPPGDRHLLVMGKSDSPHVWAGAVRRKGRFASPQLHVAPLWRSVLQCLSAALEQAGRWFFVPAPGKLEPRFMCVSHHHHRNIHMLTVNDYF